MLRIRLHGKVTYEREKTAPTKFLTAIRAFLQRVRSRQTKRGSSVTKLSGSRSRRKPNTRPRSGRRRHTVASISRIARRLRISWCFSCTHARPRQPEHSARSSCRKPMDCTKDCPCLSRSAYGSELVKPLLLREAERADERKRAEKLKKIPLELPRGLRCLHVRHGRLTPLDGFMSHDDWRGSCIDMRMSRRVLADPDHAAGRQGARRSHP